MVEQKREGRNVVTRCPNMDMFRRESARRRENEGSDRLRGIAAIEVPLRLDNCRE